MVRKSVGFNWGPAAVSTSYWTGVRLCDLLAHCGVHKTSAGARYVCFRGVQKELPQARPFISKIGAEVIQPSRVGSTTCLRLLPNASRESGPLYTLQNWT